MLKKRFWGDILAFMASILGCSVWASNAWGASGAPLEYNMPEGVTAVSHAVYGLHMTIFWVCVAIAVLVFSVMIYSLVMHRKARGSVAASFHESTTVEIIWTIIPFLILVAMAYPATRVLQQMHDTEHADLNVKITGYQWRWEYEYLGSGVKYFSNLSTPQEQIDNLETKDALYLYEVDHPLVIPVNKKVRFLLTANDVIHSWWVPQFGVKKDAVPGFINETWAKVEKPGIYRGQCAELCGVKHGYMPIVVEAKSQADFDKWLQEQRTVS